MRTQRCRVCWLGERALGPGAPGSHSRSQFPRSVKSGNGFGSPKSLLTRDRIIRWLSQAAAGCLPHAGENRRNYTLGNRAEQSSKVNVPKSPHGPGEFIPWTSPAQTSETQGTPLGLPWADSGAGLGNRVSCGCRAAPPREKGTGMRRDARARRRCSGRWSPACRVRPASECAMLRGARQLTTCEAPTCLTWGLSSQHAGLRGWAAGRRWAAATSSGDTSSSPRLRGLGAEARSEAAEAVRLS